jgi:hypothetical protein
VISEAGPLENRLAGVQVRYVVAHSAAAILNEHDSTEIFRAGDHHPHAG